MDVSAVNVGQPRRRYTSSEVFECSNRLFLAWTESVVFGWLTVDGDAVADN